MSVNWKGTFPFRDSQWEQGGRGSGVDILNQVLLVDDSPLQLSVREAILRKAGFRRVCSH